MKNSSRFAGDASWICCQAGAREHYAIPRALKRAGVGVGMITDLWWRFPPLPGGGGWAALQGRFHPDLGAREVVAFNLATLAGRIGDRIKGRDWYLCQDAANRAFQRRCLRVLEAIPENPVDRTVVAYSYAAREILSHARGRGWRTLLGQIDPGPRESRIVKEEYERLGMPVSRYYQPPAGYWESWRAEVDLADGIVVNSAWSAQCLAEEGIAMEKIHVIPCAYEAGSAAAFRRAYPAEFTKDRPMKVLFLGQPVVRKGIHRVLEAAEELIAEPVRFVIVGGGSDLTEPRLAANVEWVGPVPREEVSRYYREADVFLLPTLSDGFALTQLEASAWKLPLVVSRHCGEVVAHGGNGIVLPETSAAAIARALSGLVSDPSGLQRLSDAADPLDRFSLAAVGRQWLALAGGNQNQSGRWP